MGVIEAALNKKHHSSDEVLNKIGKKLPKKLRKKLVPFLSLLLAALTHVAGAFSSQNKPGPVPTTGNRSVSVPTGPQPTASRQFSDDTLQAYVERAEAYQIEIDNLAQNSTDANQNRVREMATHMREWTTSITDLAQRIQNFSKTS